MSNVVKKSDDFKTSNNYNGEVITNNNRVSSVGNTSERINDYSDEIMLNNNKNIVEMGYLSGIRE